MQLITRHLIAAAHNNAWANHRLLAHLFEHQTHHRGQVHAMLSRTRVPPPQLDEFYCADDAPRRVEDFRVLGFSEAAIWKAE